MAQFSQALCEQFLHFESVSLTVNCDLTLATSIDFRIRCRILRQSAWIDLNELCCFTDAAQRSGSPTAGDNTALQQVARVTVR